MIFISYRRDDSRHLVERLFDRLTSHFGEGVIFKDVNSIPYGSDFRTAVHSAVSRSSVVLAIIGNRWLNVTDSSGSRRLDNSSDFVRVEIEAALESDTPIIPILVDGATFPKPEELPQSLQDLPYRNSAVVRCDPDFRHDVDRLIEACQNFQPVEKKASTELESLSHSVNELVRLIEERAQLVLEEMESAIERAQESFLASKSHRGADSPIQGSTESSEMSEAADHRNSLTRGTSTEELVELMELDRDWSSSSVEALGAQLDSLKRSFLRLHTKHKEELCRGNYVVAHELVGHIHDILRRFYLVARPPFRNSAISYLKDVLAERIGEHERYPGILPGSLVEGFPQLLRDHYLTDSDLMANDDSTAEEKLFGSDYRKSIEEFERNLITTSKPPTPCPHCGKPLRTKRAKQCMWCGLDWHDPNRLAMLRKPS